MNVPDIILAQLNQGVANWSVIKVYADDQIRQAEKACGDLGNDWETVCRYRGRLEAMQDLNKLPDKVSAFVQKHASAVKSI